MTTPKRLVSCILSSSLLLTSPGIEAFAAVLGEAARTNTSARTVATGIPLETSMEMPPVGASLSVLNEDPLARPDLAYVIDVAAAGPTALAVEVAGPTPAIVTEVAAVAPGTRASGNGVVVAPPPPSGHPSHVTETDRTLPSSGIGEVSEPKDGEPEVGAVSRPAARVVERMAGSLDAVVNPQTSPDETGEAIGTVVDGSGGRVPGQKRSADIAAVSAAPGAEDGSGRVVSAPQLAPGDPQQEARTARARAPPDLETDSSPPPSRLDRWLSQASGFFSLFALGANPKDHPEVRGPGSSLVIAAWAVGVVVAIAATAFIFYPLAKHWLKKLRERQAILKQRRDYQEWKDSPQRTLILMGFTEPKDRSYLEGLSAYHERLLVAALEALDGQTDVIYITPKPIHPLAVELVFQTLEESRREKVRKRVHFFTADVAQNLHITPQLLNQPAKIQALAELVKGLGHPTLIRPLRTGPQEWKLLDRLQALTGLMKTVDGPLPHLAGLATKWGNYLLFKAALAWQVARGVPLEHRLRFPATKGPIHSTRELAKGIVELIKESPGARQFMVKILDMSSGGGNMYLDLSDLAEGTVTVNAVEQLLAQAPKKFYSDGMTWDRYKSLIVAEGAIVQYYVVGAENAPAPSAQVNGKDLISTHIQTLDPPDFVVFQGVTFPAEPAMQIGMRRAMEAIVAVLWGWGWFGRGSVDFLAILRGAAYLVEALEFNGRGGGATAPFLAALYVAGATVDQNGNLTDRLGKRLVYEALDHQTRPNMRIIHEGPPLDPQARERLERAENNWFMEQILGDPGRRLLYNPETGKGWVPHMASAMAVGNGVVGTFLGHSANEIKESKAAVFRLGNQLEVMHLTTVRGELASPEGGSKRYVSRPKLSTYTRARGVIEFSEFRDDDGKPPPPPSKPRRKKKRGKAPAVTPDPFAVPSRLYFRTLANDSRDLLTHLSKNKIYERLQIFLGEERWQKIGYNPATRRGVIFHPTGYTIIGATNQEISALQEEVRLMLTAFRQNNLPTSRTLGNHS